MQIEDEMSECDNAKLASISTPIIEIVKMMIEYAYLYAPLLEDCWLDSRDLSLSMQDLELRLERKEGSMIRGQYRRFIQAVVVIIWNCLTGQRDEYIGMKQLSSIRRINR